MLSFLFCLATSGDFRIAGETSSSASLVSGEPSSCRLAENDWDRGVRVRWALDRLVRLFAVMLSAGVDGVCWALDRVIRLFGALLSVPALATSLDFPTGSAASSSSSLVSNEPSSNRLAANESDRGVRLVGIDAASDDGVCRTLDRVVRLFAMLLSAGVDGVCRTLEVVRLLAVLLPIPALSILSSLIATSLRFLFLCHRGETGITLSESSSDEMVTVPEIAVAETDVNDFDLSSIPPGRYASVFGHNA